MKKFNITGLAYACHVTGLVRGVIYSAILGAITIFVFYLLHA